MGTNDRKEKESFQAKTWEVEGRCPGLRAFRLNDDGRGDASNAMASTGAEAGAGMAELRGLAARRGAAALGGGSASNTAMELQVVRLPVLLVSNVQQVVKMIINVNKQEADVILGFWSSPTSSPAWVEG